MTNELPPEPPGLEAFAVTRRFDETAVSPQELAFTFEMLKQVLSLSEGDGRPANERFAGAWHEALEHVSRLLGQHNHIAVVGWLQETATLIQTEKEIQNFLFFFQTVLQQHTALQAIKQANQGT